MSIGTPRRTAGRDRWILLLAQGFGSGRVPVAPGTVGTLPGCVWCLILLLPGNPWVYLIGTLAAIPVAVWACGEAERILGRTDPGSVVLDEIIAVPVVMSGYLWHRWRGSGELPPPGELADWWPALAAGFVLFRLFDVWKPWPIRRLQHLPGGWGVVVDDLLAGVVAAIVLGVGAWMWF